MCTGDLFRVFPQLINIHELKFTHPPAFAAIYLFSNPKPFAMMSYQPHTRRNVVSFMKIVMKIVSHENISKSKFKMFRGDESFPLNIFLNKYYP